MFETEPAAAIVVPRGLKNESCHEWILVRLCRPTFDSVRWQNLSSHHHLGGLPARNNLQSRKSHNINDANSKVILISTNRIFISTNNSRYNPVI